MKMKLVSLAVVAVALCAGQVAAAAADKAPVRADQSRAVGKKAVKPTREAAALEDGNDITRKGYIVGGVAVVAATVGAVLLLNDDNSTD